jgi:hypothetical protein
MNEFMSKRINHVLIAFSLFCSVTVEAQLEPADDHLGSDFLQPQIAAGYSAATVRNFQDNDGTFGVNSVTLTAAVPIYRSLQGTSENPTIYFMLGRGQFSTSDEDISFLSSSRAIYKSRIGITGGIATTDHHLYLVTIGGGFAEDRNTVGSPRIRATGSLLGKYQLDNSFAFIYGLSYSYTFNRGLVLPLLGTHCSLGRNLSLHIVLPFSVSLDYEEAQELHFGFHIRANGDQIHVEETAYFGTQSLPLFMKIAQVQSGFSVSFEFSRGIWLLGEAGMLRNRNFAIGTLDKNLISSKIDNSGYSTIVLRYDLGNFESWGD